MAQLNKGELINAIMTVARTSAEFHNKPFKSADMFFDLIGLPETELTALCNKLNIAITK